MNLKPRFIMKNSVKNKFLKFPTITPYRSCNSQWKSVALPSLPGVKIVRLSWQYWMTRRYKKSVRMRIRNHELTTCSSNTRNSLVFTSRVSLSNASIMNAGSHCQLKQNIIVNLWMGKWRDFHRKNGILTVRGRQIKALKISSFQNQSMKYSSCTGAKWE